MNGQLGLMVGGDSRAPLEWEPKLRPVDEVQTMKAVKSPVAFVFLAARAMVEGGVSILEDVLGHASLRHMEYNEGDLKKNGINLSLI